MENQTASLTEKVKQVKGLIAQSLKDNRASTAERSLELAKQLIKTVEGEVLANPFVTDVAIANLVQFLRAPFWAQAERHVVSLRKAA